MPAPHCSVFLQAGCPSCRPTNSIKALEDTKRTQKYNRTHTHTLTLRSVLTRMELGVSRSTQPSDVCRIWAAVLSLWWFRLLRGYINTLTCVTHTPVQQPFVWDYPGEPVPERQKPIWILLKQETVKGSGISRDICKSAPRSRQVTMPAPHRSVFLQAGCPSCCPTNSVKALKTCVAYWQLIRHLS